MSYIILIASQGFFAAKEDGSIFKCALLSGPPGVGKTTTATLVCKVSLESSFIYILHLLNAGGGSGSLFKKELVLYFGIK